MFEYCRPDASGRVTPMIQWTPTRWAGFALDLLLIVTLLGFGVVFYSVFSLDNEWAKGVSQSSCTSGDLLQNSACQRQNAVMSNLYQNFNALERDWVAQSSVAQAAIVTVLWPLFGFDNAVSVDEDKDQDESRRGLPPQQVDSIVRTHQWMKNLFHCMRYEPLAYRSCDGDDYTERICKKVLDLWMEPAHEEQHVSAWVGRPPPWVHLRITLTPIFFRLDTRQQLEVIVHECTHIYEQTVDGECVYAFAFVGAHRTSVDCMYAANVTPLS